LDPPKGVSAPGLVSLFYGLFYERFSRSGGDEATFFVFALLVIPLFFLVSLAYTAIKAVGKRIG
jgi:hypothetical protein